MRSLSAVFTTFVLILATFPANTPCMAAGPRETVEKPVVDSVKIRQETQQQEEQWRAEKEALLLQFEQLEQRNTFLEAQQQAKTAGNQALRERIAKKQHELDEIEQIQKEIQPLIAKIHADLEQCVARDLPFLPDERRQRLDRLREVVGNPEISVSEQFRKVMEALLVETEYGSTIETYQQTIRLEDRDMLVNVFRLGRIALFFQTTDASTCGYFNMADSSWTTLPPACNASIQTALEIASKRQPADLIALPLGRLVL